MVAHPIETGKAVVSGLKNIGVGLVSKAAGALGAEQDLEKKAVAEATVNDIAESPLMKFVTGKGDAELKRYVAENPAHALFDLFTTVIPGVGAAGKAAKVTKIPGIAQAGRAVETAAKYADPIGGAVKVAKEAVVLPAQITTYVTSGVGVPTQRLIASVGRGAETQKLVRNPAGGGAVLRAASPSEVRKEFLTAQSGDAAPLFDAVTNAYEKIIDDNVKAHNAKIRSMGAAAPRMDWAPLLDEIDNLQNNKYVSYGTPSGEAKRAQAILAEIRKVVEDKLRQQRASGVAPTFEQMNTQKRLIADDYFSPGDRPQAAMDVYNKLKEMLGAAAPDYMPALEAAEANIAHVKALKAATGAGRPSSNEAAVLAKMLRSEKSPSGRALLEEVIEKNPIIKYMMAGHVTSAWLKNSDLAQTIRMLAGFGASAAGMLPHFAAGLAATSPKIVGRANYLLGRAGGMLPGPAPSLGAAYLATGQEAGTAPGPSASADNDLQRRQLQVESGGRQFTKTGEPVTSPKGATGIAQIMPTTGSEAAALAGEEWNPERLRTDEAYNRRLGKAYLDKQIADFGGDTVAGLAAYNAGPNAVRRAMQRARAEGGNYLAYLPRETQDYVRKIMSGPNVAARGGRIQRASGGRTGVNHAAEAARLVLLAERGKKELGKRTEPLLQKHDDEVAVALSAANKAI